MAKINFDKMSKKLETANPAKGRKKRLQINKEDNELFFDFIFKPALKEKLKADKAKSKSRR